MNQRADRVFLDDILESIQKIQVYTQQISEVDFHQNSQIQDAVIRRLEVIGEAVKNLSPSAKDLDSTIPWRQIAGMRDVLIHGYFGVNLQRIWRVIEDDLPDLKQKILIIREKLSS
jgi:uncharacterized protein with HEPN domain